MQVRIVSALALLVMLFFVVPSQATATCLALCEPEDSTPAPQPTPAPEPPAPEPAPEPEPPGDTVHPAGAERLLHLINQSRSEHGMPAMAARADVASIAVDHSKAMAAEGDIWHNDAYFTSATKQRLRAKTVGENVALNSSIDDAHRRLMNSPGHRANILNAAFTVVGIGVVQKGGGSYYITQDFVQPLPETAAAKPTGTTERPRGGAPAPAATPSTAAPAAAPTTTEALPTTTVPEDSAGSIATTTSMPRQLQAGAVPSDAKSAMTFVALLLLGATGAVAGRHLSRQRGRRPATAS